MPTATKTAQPPELPVEGLLSVLDAIEGGLIDTRHDKKGVLKTDIPGTYPFIPLKASRFITLLQAAVPHVKTAPRHQLGFKALSYRSFLDIGAGYGSKVEIANMVLGQEKGIPWVAKGIEINPRYLGGMMARDVDQADGLMYDGYANHDILYMYCPFKDETLQVKLQQAAISGAASGAVIIFAGCCKPMTKDMDAPFTDVMEPVGKPTRGTYHTTEIWRKRQTESVPRKKGA